MKPNNQTKAAPKRHRILIWMSGGMMCVLTFWLLGFIIGDIGSLPGPDYNELEQERLDQALVDRSKQLQREIASAKRDTNNRQTTQRLLRESINNSQRTLTQLMGVQKVALEKGAEFSERQQQAMTENLELFLANQRRDQELNAEIVELSQQQQELDSQLRTLNTQLEAARAPIRDEHRHLMERHGLKTGGFKLLVLVPLLVASVTLLYRMKKKVSPYLPLANAVAIAIAVKVGIVMHDHFPTRYFKYVLIITALAIVTAILISLLRAAAFPKRSWLLKQYREAYESFLCPKCEFPIRRGPLRFLSWTRASIRKLRPTTLDSGGDSSEPYTCPMCGTSLYEKCGKCGSTRHSLLPACEHCGTTKDVENNEASVN